MYMRNQANNLTTSNFESCATQHLLFSSFKASSYWTFSYSRKFSQNNKQKRPVHWLRCLVSLSTLSVEVFLCFVPRDRSPQKLYRTLTPIGLVIVKGSEEAFLRVQGHQLLHWSIDPLLGSLTCFGLASWGQVATFTPKISSYENYSHHA